MSVAPTAAAVLEHLYATMYCLMLLAEAGGGGQVARVAQVGQQELWPGIAHLGGDQQGFTAWRMRREEASQERRPRGPLVADKE